MASQPANAEMMHRTRARAPIVGVVLSRDIFARPPIAPEPSRRVDGA